jgi:hypothetical protein
MCGYYRLAIPFLPTSLRRLRSSNNERSYVLQLIGNHPGRSKDAVQEQYCFYLTFYVWTEMESPDVEPAHSCLIVPHEMYRSSLLP